MSTKYMIEVECFTHYEPDIDYYTKDVYGARLLCRDSEDPDAKWEVCKEVWSNSPASAFIGVNHHRAKLEGHW